MKWRHSSNSTRGTYLMLGRLLDPSRRQRTIGTAIPRAIRHWKEQTLCLDKALDRKTLKDIKI
jgi:hypothetical protein